MSYWYPRAAVQLRILPEDYKLVSDPTLQQVYTLNVIARDVTVSRNDYKTADTFSMEIDYKNFPFDPRTIRSCGVVIYMQDVEKNYNEDGSVNAIIPGDATKVNPKITNAVFIGFVDEDSIELSENKRSVKFTGRDCTALLIDQKYAVNAPIFPTQPLDIVFKTLLAAFSATAKIAVINTTGGVLPTLAQYYPGFGNKLAGGINTGGGQRETYWEIIQDMSNRAGLICYMGTTVQNGDIVPALFLSTPKNQNIGLDQSTGNPIAETIDDIKIIYGKNVKNLEMKRKLGRLKNFNIQVRCRVGKKVLIAKIPEEANQAWCDAYGIQRAIVQIPVLKPDGSLDTTQLHYAPYISFPASNISTHAALVTIGQTLYEQYSLQQLEGSFETFEMLGRGTTKDSNVDNKSSFKAYDMTQIVKGQTICIEIDTDDLNAISRLSTVGARTDYLIKKSYDKGVAAIFAKTMGKMSPRFQIKDYTMNVNQDRGFKLSVRFQNIIDTTQNGLS